MRAAVAAMIVLAGCGFTRAHPRATGMAATGTLTAALIVLPYASDCTGQPGENCREQVLEAGGVGIVVGTIIAILVGHELAPHAEPPPEAPPRWRPDHTK